MDYLISLILSLFLFVSSTVLSISHATADERENMGDAITIPDEVKPFIPDGFYPIFLDQADLNRDKRSDYLMVLEDNTQRGMNNWNPDREITETARPLVILQRNDDGKLVQVKKNDKVVFCHICGGAFGDPFEGIQITPKGFIVDLYGGSNWRWAKHYEFGYSRIDRTWQLVKVETTNYHTSAPDEAVIKILKPPKDFGKIDLADFDPEKLKSEDVNTTEQDIETEEDK